MVADKKVETAQISKYDFSFSQRLVSYILALVFPGLGHYYIGKKKNAVIFGVSIIALFVFGILVGADLGMETENKNIIGVLGMQYFFQFILPVLTSIAKICAGVILYYPGVLLQDFTLDMHQGLSATYLEIGTNCCIIAGLLNLLVVINLFYFHNKVVFVSDTSKKDAQ